MIETFRCDANGLVVRDRSGKIKFNSEVGGIIKLGGTPIVWMHVGASIACSGTFLWAWSVKGLYFNGYAQPSPAYGTQTTTGCST